MSEEITHPAARANLKSISYTMSGDKEAWLALYADDAVVHDPVGKSPMDESGEGHRGKAAIEQFWDSVIGPSNVEITVHQRCPSGDRHCAVLQSAVNDLGNGIKTRVDMVAVYEVNEDGLIVSMCAYWDFSQMERQLKDLGLM